jgi:hypothetical protein
MINAKDAQMACGTPYFMAPEIELEKDKYSDLFSRRILFGYNFSTWWLQQKGNATIQTGY